MNAPQIRVLVVDDHPIVREGLQSLIGRQADMVVVGEAENGEEALRMAATMQPEVVVLDLRMPVMDGIAALPRLRALVPGLRVVVLTAYDSDGLIHGALQAGASAYLLKDSSRTDLTDTIRAVHAGQRRIPPEVAARLAERMSLPELTGRELEVLQCMASGCDNREIAHRLSIGEGTVKTHVNRILAKLEASDRTRAVTTALRRGLVELS